MRQRLLLASCLLGFAACVPGARYLNAFPASAPAPPRTDYDVLIAAALHYAFVSPGDVSDRQFLPDPRRIVLSSEVLRIGGEPADTLTAHALPATGRVEFVLLRPDQYHALARARGEFAHGSVGRPVVRGDTAEVSVGVRHLVRIDPPSLSVDGFSYGGAGYGLRFVRRGTEWVPLGPFYYVSS